MLLLRPDDPPLVIRACPFARLAPDARGHPEVRLAYATYTHILTRRGGDAALVLRQMRHVATRPTHWGRLTADPRRIELYRLDAAEEVGVCVSLKCLTDETWVNTAYPLGLRVLLKHVRSDRLWVVDGEEEVPRAENQVDAAPPAPPGVARSKRSWADRPRGPSLPHEGVHGDRPRAPSCVSRTNVPTLDLACGGGPGSAGERARPAPTVSPVFGALVQVTSVASFLAFLAGFRARTDGVAEERHAADA